MSEPDSSSSSKTSSIADLKNSNRRLLKPWQTLNSTSFSTWIENQGFSQDPTLPDNIPDGRHVYLVFGPKIFAELARHWSVYSQGHFYHLSLDEQGRPKLKVEDCTQAQDVKQELPQEESAATADFQPDINADAPQDEPTQQTIKHEIALFVLEVGKTTYPPEKLRDIATEIMSHYTEYHLLLANCQMFVRNFLEKILKTRTDSSAFVGIRKQVIQWDLYGRNSGFEHHSRYNGFEIKAPPAKSTSILNFIDFVRTDWEMNAIGKLYTHGAFEPGAADPFGRMGYLKYSQQLLKDGMPGDAFKTGLVEKSTHFMEDIKAKRWKDAFSGREADKQADEKARQTNEMLGVPKRR